MWTVFQQQFYDLDWHLWLMCEREHTIEAIMGMKHFFTLDYRLTWFSRCKWANCVEHKNNIKHVRNLWWTSVAFFFGGSTFMYLLLNWSSNQKSIFPFATIKKNVFKVLFSSAMHLVLKWIININVLSIRFCFEYSRNVLFLFHKMKSSLKIQLPRIWMFISFIQCLLLFFQFERKQNRSFGIMFSCSCACSFMPN